MNMALIGGLSRRQANGVMQLVVAGQVFCGVLLRVGACLCKGFDQPHFHVHHLLGIEAERQQQIGLVFVQQGKALGAATAG